MMNNFQLFEQSMLPDFKDLECFYLEKIKEGAIKKPPL